VYRQSLTGHDLSVEEGTEKVPDDGHYYVLFQGEQKGRFRSLKQATKRYDENQGDVEPAVRGPVPGSIRGRDTAPRDGGTV